MSTAEHGLPAPDAGIAATTRATSSPPGRLTPPESCPVDDLLKVKLGKASS